MGGPARILGPYGVRHRPDGNRLPGDAFASLRRHHRAEPIAEVQDAGRNTPCYSHLPTCRASPLSRVTQPDAWPIACPHDGILSPASLQDGAGASVPQPLL